MFEVKSGNGNGDPPPSVGNGMILREGVAKGVRVVSDKNGNPIPAVVLDGTVILRNQFYSNCILQPK